MSRSGAAVLLACLGLVACEDFERAAEECKTHNAVRRVSMAHPWTPPPDTRTGLASLADSPDLIRIEVASNMAGLIYQLRQIREAQWLVEDPSPDANERLLAAFQEAEAAAEAGAGTLGNWRTYEVATALAFVLRERKVREAIPHLARALERRLLAPKGASILFFLMVQSSLWELLGKPTLPPGGSAHVRVFLIEAAR